MEPGYREEIMDPNFITASDWDRIGKLILFLFGLPVSAILFAFPLLFARAIIPSLVGTGHLPKRALFLQPVAYVTASIGLICLVFVLSNIVGRSEVIENFYHRWWI